MRARERLMPDPPVVTPTWIFVRGTERLTIQRLSDTELCWFSDTDPKACFTFRGLVELVTFQVGLEDDLLEEGWTLTEFSPERRHALGDRRGTRRPDADRRLLQRPRWPSH